MKGRWMNKLHTFILTTVLCSMMHGLTASEGRQMVFFDQKTIDGFKTVGKGYGVLLLAANMQIFNRVYINPKPNYLDECGNSRRSWYDPRFPKWQNVVRG